MNKCSSSFNSMRMDFNLHGIVVMFLLAVLHKLGFFFSFHKHIFSLKYSCALFWHYSGLLANRIDQYYFHVELVNFCPISPRVVRGLEL